MAKTREQLIKEEIKSLELQRKSLDLQSDIMIAKQHLLEIQLEKAGKKAEGIDEKLIKLKNQLAEEICNKKVQDQCK